MHATNSALAPASLAELAGRPLFEPLRALLAALPGPGAPPMLDAVFSQNADSASAPAAIRFVAPDDVPMAYEERIVTRAEVVTRPRNWHDFFNALVWVRFPRTKHCLAQLHADGIRAPRSDGRRGPVRDAATQFDESGIVVVSEDEHLLELLAERRWKALFWTQREAVRQRMRFLVFGHGLYDALRAPFYRMCGRAAAVTVPAGCTGEPVTALCARVDPILADRFARRTWYPRPGALPALPLLGIPGLCAENEDAAYYDDAEQFRPPPRT